MYSNAIQKLWVVKWKTVAGCYTPLTGSACFFFGFSKSWVSTCKNSAAFCLCLFVYEESYCARSKGFNRGSVVLSASGRGLDIGCRGDMFMWQHHLTALTLHRQTPSKESTVYLLKKYRHTFLLPNVHQVDGLICFIFFKQGLECLKHKGYIWAGMPLIHNWVLE